MREELNLVNVIIYDGNRKVNWDFRDSKPLNEALGKFGFKWKKNSFAHKLLDFGTMPRRRKHR